MRRYSHKKIESKWQKYWEKEKMYQAKDNSDKPKYYCLIEFPYPSGDGLHVGHMRSYSAIDAIARQKRMAGFNVLYPIGWDAFGLPTENYAIKTKQHPSDVTEKNVTTFKRQIKSAGISFDWSREIKTTNPKYYKWTQWIFLQLFKAGLAYQKEMPINWCPKCKTGLANEEVVSGKCERCGAETFKKKMKQWMLKITDYADKLLDGLKQVDYLDKIRIQQENWIGRSEGAEIKFKIKGADFSLNVFTTRPDTLFGATYMVVCPEHQLIANFKSQISNLKEVKKYVEKSKKKSDLQRTDLAKEKTGVEVKGIKAVNPVNEKEIPVWVGDYVLPHYGSGAIMAVPAHDQRDFEFAKKYGLPIKQVIQNEAKRSEKSRRKPRDPSASPQDDSVYEGEGELVNSNKFNGMKSEKAREEIVKWLNKKGLAKKDVNYKLRDWVFSRQHYWGEPIPLVHCSKCGIVPVPEEELPVELPDVKKYEPTDTGESPLANIEEWVNVKCPKCGAPAKRETDTMPNWAGSSWYFLRYCDPKNDQKFADPKKLKYWLPVDLYNGGMEHTTLHLLYSRFWHKFLYDQGLVPTSEPYKVRRSHGMVLAEDGRKMSKSLDNVVNPDDIIEDYGADSLRLYEMFMGPFGEAIPWSTEGLVGMRRFLKKVWHLFEKVDQELENGQQQLETKIHKTIKKVTQDLKAMKFNTAIAALMELVNKMQKQEKISLAYYEILLKLLAPFAPHITEELWQGSVGLGRKKSIHLEGWPEHDPQKIIKEEFDLIIQVNGKMRGKIKAPVGLKEEEAVQLAQQDSNVKKYLQEATIKKTIFVSDKLINFVTA